MPADSTSPTRNDAVRGARMWLTLAAEPGNPQLHSFVQQHGPEAAVDALRTGQAPPELLALLGGERRVAELDARIREQLTRTERAGARFAIPEDPEWPAQLNETVTGTAAGDLVGPLGLWIRGSRPLTDAVAGAVAVVGSRASTAYGEHVAGELAAGLAQRGRPVLSGLGYGIDAAAHRGALLTGVTSAVLACGVDRTYPVAHTPLADRIADSGLLISEYAPGTAPAAHRFAARNRLLAMLSHGLVVVEAAARSGALATARRATDLGRAVMAVPGPVTSATSVGTHQLLRDGAHLVTSAADVDAALTQ